MMSLNKTNIFRPLLSKICFCLSVIHTTVLVKRGGIIVTDFFELVCSSVFECAVDGTSYPVIGYVSIPQVGC